MAGKGTDRFATGGRNNVTTRDADAAQQVTERFLSSPPPAQAYGGLKTSPQAAIEYEPNVAAPVDGSDRLARSLSPFVIQVEPPLVFGAEPLFLDGSGDDRPNVGLYSAATKGNTRYSSARTRLAQSAYATANYRQVSFDEQVSRATGEQEVATPGAKSPQTRAPRSAQTPDTLGKPSIADLEVAVDIASQLKTILSTPPLILLINPTEISLSRAKIQQYSDRTRHGFVFHAWGEDQERLQIQARCGAFLSAGRGVSHASKRDSAAWQNLMAAFQFYRNNGYIYDTVGQSYANHFVGALSIQYDGKTYIGNMNNFSWSHDESNELGGVTFSMEFVANTIVDVPTASSTVRQMRTPSTARNSLPSRRGPSIIDQFLAASGQPGLEVGTEDSSTLAPPEFAGSSDPLVTPPVGSVEASDAPGTGGFQTPTQEEIAVLSASDALTDEQSFNVVFGAPEPFGIE